MKKNKIFIFVTLFFIVSCNKGLWLNEHSYRASKPKFEILKQEFKGNDLINSDFLYISTKKFTDYNGINHISYLGFYKDGRMIMDSYKEDKTLNTVIAKNSFKNAYSIGYYTTMNNAIKTECFIEGDRGTYLVKEGIIKKDTIIMNEIINHFYKKEIRSDTLIKSSFKLME